MYKNYISLSGIISRLLKNPLLEDLSEDDAIESALDCIGLIGTENMLKECVSFIDVQKFRGAIPSDASTINSIRYVVDNGLPTVEAEASRVEYIDSSTETTYKMLDTLSTKINISDNTDRKYLPMRPASTPYHMSNSKDYSGIPDLTYSINGSFVYTSFETGTIEISYNTLNTSNTGELLLPNDINVIKAVENYIKLQFYTPLWEMGKISDKVVDRIEREYDWYIAKSQTSTREMSLDEREALSNSLTRLIDNNSGADDFYQNLTQREQRLRH